VSGEVERCGYDILVDPVHGLQLGDKLKRVSGIFIRRG
jgi:hypothetical protein